MQLIAAQGFNSHAWEWSVDGGTTFFSAGSVNSPPNEFALRTVDFTFGGAPTTAEVLIVRTVMSGGGGNAAGYTRMDNISFLGNATLIPEPLTYAFLLGGLALIGVGLRRRFQAVAQSGLGV